MKLKELLRKVNCDPKYAGLGFIVNVLSTGCSKPATRIKALVKLVDSGREVSPMQFIMPYEAILLDGKCVVTMPLLDRGEEIPYDKDWYKR